MYVYLKLNIILYGSYSSRGGGGVIVNIYVCVMLAEGGGGCIW